MMSNQHSANIHETMAAEPQTVERRNLSILFGQGTFSTIAWTMANPSVVLTYLAISLDLPVFLAGMLVTFSQASKLFTALFGTPVAARRPKKKIDLAATDIILAICFLLALTAAAFGTSLIVAICFVLVILVVGAAGEYQSIMTAGFYGDVLNSQSRMRLLYTVMTLGGIGTGSLALIAHRTFIDDAPFTRHVALVTIGVVCFLVASAVILLVREYTKNDQPEPATEPQRKPLKFSVGKHFHEVYGNFQVLWKMEWFRRYLRVRLALLTVEMSIPFYAILAALSHHHTPKGMSALIISSATALIVSGPLWRAVGIVSTRSVMIAGASLAAFAGVLLVANYFLAIIPEPLIHAIALFIVTIAVRGVSTARSLYFMDVAPEEYRVIGIGVSKVAVRIFGIGLSFLMASVAHIQHVIWAILILALINAATAVLTYRTADTSDAGEAA
ncbi:MFS transporter [Hoeflea sp. TYP-13]|uniref:MFS transporter n=1 Tax=Hoeflea sp. TYP-13 TaxID=3230023 RepID=UPI0034C6C21C